MSLNKSKVFDEHNSLNRKKNIGVRSQNNISAYVQDFIEGYVAPLVNEESLVLSVGLTHCYGFHQKNIRYANIKHRNWHQNNTLTSKDQLSETYDIIICDENVLNYADPMEMIEKCYNLLRKNGFLLIAYNNSNSSEFLFKKSFNKRAFFSVASAQKTWRYSDAWINEILYFNKLEVVKKGKFHTGGLVSKLFKIKGQCKTIPLVNIAPNTIILCKKTN